ncbi:MAG: transglutaminase-like domain-containing protein, partial [Pirellulaceae bacterium]|nr:transglutaminase-like domain-containing protein [Pirellulaceae bacterium]
HLASSAMIQSGDPAISRQAARILPETEDPWQLALALEKHVHMLIDRKDYSQAFASALDVLESRQGDCTEHAVLLAALCRARKIPTRIAVGLVYVPGESPGYGYHMWNEVWIGDRWIGLDATTGGGRTGADRIKILDTRLGDAEAHLPLASLLSWIGQGRLEILSDR